MGRHVATAPSDQLPSVRAVALVDVPLSYCAKGYNTRVVFLPSASPLVAFVIIFLPENHYQQTGSGFFSLNYIIIVCLEQRFPNGGPRNPGVP